VQISALLNIQSWQSRNDKAREDDQRNLDSRLSQLEANQDQLMTTLSKSVSFVRCKISMQLAYLDATHKNMISMMASLQRYLDQRPARDRERQFYSHSLECLSIASGCVVELDKWTITPFEVEFGPEIGSGGL
jgi:2'-5' RNA ligase